ncbi:MAG: hypothetical protein H7068_08135 [Pedobacter sp.]|nr:hypothetical protein [Chitinophagaceae bacterium]
MKKLYYLLIINNLKRTFRQNHQTNNEILKPPATQYAILKLFAKTNGKVLTHLSIFKS